MDRGDAAPDVDTAGTVVLEAGVIDRQPRCFGAYQETVTTVVARDAVEDKHIDPGGGGADTLAGEVVNHALLDVYLGGVNDVDAVNDRALAIEGEPAQRHNRISLVDGKRAAENDCMAVSVDRDRPHDSGVQTVVARVEDTKFATRRRSVDPPL